MQELIHVICVAHKRLPELRVFIQSWLNQTNPDWSMTVIHDGECQEFIDLMSEPIYKNPAIRYLCTETRYNDYGHTLREEGLKQATGIYTLLTNGDNYFIPKTVELLATAAQKFKDKGTDYPDILLFDMIHAHTNPGDRIQPQYNLFKVRFKYLSIDVSSAVVKTSIATKVGFRDKSFAGDQTYFQDIKKMYPRLTVDKVDSVLLVHN